MQARSPGSRASARTCQRQVESAPPETRQVTSPPGGMSSCRRMSSSTRSLTAARSGSCRDGACRPFRRGGSRARSRDGRTGTRPGSPRAAGGQRSRRARCAFPWFRASGSTQTCWSWTALGVHADASALNRIVSVLPPDPRSAVVDLRLRPPAKAVRIGAERIAAELLLVRGRAGRHEQLEVVRRRLAQAGAARLRRFVDHEDGLAGTILTWRAVVRRNRLPELGHRFFAADDHPRPGVDEAGEGARSPVRKGRRSRPCARRPAGVRRGRSRSGGRRRAGRGPR